MPRRICLLAMLLYNIVYQCGCSEGLAETETASNITGKVGESVRFPYSVKASQNFSVELTFDKFTLVTWYPQQILDVHEEYKGRVSNHNDSIWLNRLSLSDSGLYQIKTDFMSGALKPPEYTYFHLKVFEPVSKPNITAECLGNNVSLSCFSSQGTEVTYSWETLPPCGDDSCVHLGQRRVLPLHHVPPSTYRCMAHNPVSNATSDSIDLKMCSTQGLQAIGVPALSATSSFLVFGALILLYMRKKHKQDNDESEAVIDEPIMEEELPSAVPSIDPVYVSKPCSVYHSNNFKPSAQTEYASVL